MEHLSWILCVLSDHKGQKSPKACGIGKEPVSIRQLRWTERKRAPYVGCIEKVMLLLMAAKCTYIVVTQEFILMTQLYSDAWSRLPNRNTKSSPVTLINGWLTTLGGQSHSKYSNELFSLTEKGSGRRWWTKKFPPMPTKRCMITVATVHWNYIDSGWRVSG